MSIDKGKYQQEIQTVGLKTIQNFQPIVKQGAFDLIDVFKNVVDDIITDLFESKKIRKDEKKWLLKRQKSNH